MRWTLTTGVASNLYERLGTRLAANLMHGILLLEAIQGAIKTKVTSRAPFNAQAFAIRFELIRFVSIRFGSIRFGLTLGSPG